MTISKKYIRWLSGKVPDGLLDSPIFIGVQVDTNNNNIKAQNVWFHKFENGQTILPLVVGRFTRYNAEWKEIKRKDLPKENCYRQVEWHWTEFHWSDRIERSDIRDVPYQRYPREFSPPPWIELSYFDWKIVAGPFHGRNDPDILIHGINLLLEIFGECSVLDTNMNIFTSRVRNLNWKILPPWKRTWQEIKDTLIEPLIAHKPSERKTFEERVKYIESKKPDFHAIWMAGYSGYIIFWFETLGVFICESIMRGNAIYVFNEDWENLSKKTKSEILSAKAMDERIVHYWDWRAKINKLTS